MSHEQPAEKPLLVSVERARTMLGLGRTKIYELLNAGEIPSRILGGRRLIPVAALEALAAQPERTQ